MASTARRSIVPGPGSNAPQGKSPEEENKGFDSEDGDENEHSSENARLQKRLIQMKYLEQENHNLQLDVDDLNQTLKINKDIIKSLLEGDKKFDA